jgi:uncharacterized membrane protein YdjX (TVP38/TMEM64 family)
LHTEASSLAAKVLKLGFLILAFVMLHAFVDVVGAVLEHPIDQYGWFCAMAVMALGMPILAISRRKFAPRALLLLRSVRAAKRNAMLSGLITLRL